MLLQAQLQVPAATVLRWRRRWAALFAQRPRRESVNKEPVGGMRLTGRGGRAAAPEVAEQARVPPRNLAAGWAEQQRPTW